MLVLSEPHNKLCTCYCWGKMENVRLTSQPNNLCDYFKCIEIEIQCRARFNTVLKSSPTLVSVRIVNDGVNWCGQWVRHRAAPHSTKTQIHIISIFINEQFNHLNIIGFMTYITCCLLCIYNTPHLFVIIMFYGRLSDNIFILFKYLFGYYILNKLIIVCIYEVCGVCVCGVYNHIRNYMCICSRACLAAIEME